MNFKLLCSLIILIFSFTLVYGQKVTSFTEKKEYKIEEKITVEFEVNAEVDSNTSLICNGFTILKGPSKSTSYSINNGKIANSYRLTYVLKANRVGEIWVPSPYFYIKGKPEMGPIIVLKISGNNLSEEELKKLQIDSFRESYVKPSGTLRYVVGDSLGYIEVYNVPNWDFVRALTTEEVIKLKQK